MDTSVRRVWHGVMKVTQELGMIASHHRWRGLAVAATAFVPDVAECLRRQLRLEEELPGPFTWGADMTSGLNLYSYKKACE